MLIANFANIIAINIIYFQTDLFGFKCQSSLWTLITIKFVEYSLVLASHHLVESIPMFVISWITCGFFWSKRQEKSRFCVATYIPFICRELEIWIFCVQKSLSVRSNSNRCPYFSWNQSYMSYWMHRVFLLFFLIINFFFMKQFVSQIFTIIETVGYHFL